MIMEIWPILVRFGNEDDMLFMTLNSRQEN